VASIVTSDIPPTFTLGKQVLRKVILPVERDSTFTKTVATKGITWKKITPHVPWQGVFY
ncbi:hypothetical protein Angca_000538, partial [Angiostrongylus cantonensis]